MDVLPPVTPPPQGGPVKTTFIRRKVPAGGVPPVHALTAAEVAHRLASRQAEESQHQQRRQLEAKLYDELQAEERNGADDAFAPSRPAGAPVSPSKRALLMKKVPAAAAATTAAQQNPATAAASLQSPPRSSAVQPLSLALSSALGIGPGSASYQGPGASAKDWDVVGSPKRFRAEAREIEQRRRDQEEEERQDQEEEEKYNGGDSALSTSRSGDLALPAGQSSASQGLAQRLVASLNSTQLPRKTQIGAPRGARSVGKTWQHSEFLAHKKAAQSKAIGKLVQNQIFTQEQERVRLGLATDNVPVLASLVIKGTDMFDVGEIDESAWYAAHAGTNTQSSQREQLDPAAEEEHQRQAARAAKKARKRALAAQQQAFAAPVQGPSLVLTKERLFFPIELGPIARVAGEGEDSTLTSSAPVVGSAASTPPIPGVSDRVSREVTLKNNGSTAVEYKWRACPSALACAADTVADASRAPKVQSATALGLFSSSSPAGTLLPGEEVRVTFTFVPPPATPLDTGVFVRRLALDTVPRLSRPLTEAAAALAKEQASGGVSPRVHDLTLTGSLTRVDTTSVSRAQLRDQLSSWATLHATQAALRLAVSAVREPPPSDELHREIFYMKNRDQLLFFYQEHLSTWRQLALDVYSKQKRALRRTLEWDYSASSLKQWIENIPPRHAASRAGLMARYQELLALCQVRPAPHPIRYAVAYGLLSGIGAAIPSLATQLAVDHGCSERLEQEVRKEREEVARKADEEMKAKLPFHLRGGPAHVNPNSLTPEQRSLREEQAAHAKALKDAQEAEDALRRGERAAALAAASTKLHEEIRGQLSAAVSYFDFLAAPRHTNLGPQAMDPEKAIAQATAAAGAAGESTVDLSILRPVAAPVIELGKPGKERPKSSKKKATEEEPKDSARASKKSAAAAAAALSSPPTSRPTTPGQRFPAAVGLSPAEEAQLAEALAHPTAYSSSELESLRGSSLEAFLELESARLAGGAPSVKQRLVYAGNGYNTPDTGVHIPTPEELKLKEERERMARYGQTVPQSIKEMERRKRDAMHPMAPLAARQVLATAAGAYFSLAYTRERGVWGWTAADVVPSESADEAAALEAAQAKDPKRKAGPAGGSNAKALGRTKIQEARRSILGLLAPPVVVDASKGKPGDKSAGGSGAGAAPVKKAADGKASPRASTTSLAGKSSSTKKKDATSSRPGSGSLSARGVSPAPGATAGGPLVPVVPFASQPLALLATANGAAPLPIYLPELQGFQIVSLAVGVHYALFATSLGALFAWEHATRKLHVLVAKQYPGMAEERKHRFTLKAVELAVASGAGSSPSDDSKSTSRPSSSLGGRKSSGDLTGRSTKRSNAPDDSKKAPTSGRKVSRSGNTNASSGGKNEPEVLAVDSAAYEAELIRTDRLAHDADMLASGKSIAAVVVGGSARLSAQVHYATAAADFEFTLVLTKDGCVYSSMLAPPTTTAADAAGDKSKKDAGAAAAVAKKDKEREQSTAMLGIGEKTKEALKSEKEKGAAAAQALAAADKAEASPAHFELITALHPANLSAGAGGVDVRIVSLSVGYAHCLALASDGSVWSWGAEGPWLGLAAQDVGGKDAKKPRIAPVKIELLSKIELPPLPRPGTAAETAAAAALPTSAASPSTGAKLVPGLKVRPGSGPKDASLSARKNSTTAGGKKAEAASAAVEDPSTRGPIDPIVSVAAGAFHSLALTASGAVFAWGRNTESQLGLGDEKDRDAPTLVPSLSPSHDPKLLAAAIEKANAPPPKVEKNAPRVGMSPMSPRGSTPAGSSLAVGPTPLSPFLKVVSLAAGGAHSLAVAAPLPAAIQIDADGHERTLAASVVMAFGLGSAGALGQGTMEDAPQPSPVRFFDGLVVKELVAGADATQAVVQREATSSGLVVDEDDLPPAIILEPGKPLPEPTTEE